MFELKGKIEFEPIILTKKHKAQSSWKKTAIVYLNDDTFAYYAWFIEKRFNLKLNKPIRGSHITIINDIVDNNVYNEANKFFNGKELTFQLDPTNIRSNDKGHWWVKIYSDDAKNIRRTMCLDPNPYYGLHLTIGQANHLNLEHSKYIYRQCKIFNL